MAPPSPHDRLFQAVFRCPRQTASWLASFLPASVRQALDLVALAPWPGQALGLRTRSHAADLAFTLRALADGADVRGSIRWWREPPAPHRLVSVEEGVGKMRAAVAARGDTGIVVAGRTSAPAITGVADAIARARAYAACGVDAIFLVGVKTRADLDAIAGEVRLPLILGGAGPEIVDPDYLSSRGVRVCLQGHQPFAAAVQAIHDTLSALRTGTPPAQLTGVADELLMKRLTRDEAVRRQGREWL